MRIGIISDTHLESSMKSIPKEVYDVFNGVDFIFHAGDILEMKILNDLSYIAPVFAVYGNNDKQDVMNTLTSKRIVKINKFRIGITHGHEGIGNSTLDRAINNFSNEDIDCIIFGHSHIPYNDVHDGILLFNPGSATAKRKQPKCSVGILNIKDSIEGEIITY